MSNVDGAGDVTGAVDLSNEPGSESETGFDGPEKGAERRYRLFAYTFRGVRHSLREFDWRLSQWVEALSGRAQYFSPEDDEVGRLRRRLESLNDEMQNRGIYDSSEGGDPVAPVLAELNRVGPWMGPVQYQRNLSQVKRMELLVLEQVRQQEHPDDEWVVNRLRQRALEVSLQADVEELDEDYRREMTVLLEQDEPVDEYHRRISVALNGLYRHHRDTHMQSVRGALLESQLRFFLFVVVLCLLSLFAIWAYFFGEVGVSPTVSLFSTPFIGTVVLFGALGAAVSSLMSLSSVLNDSAIPERVGSRWLAVSRVTVGATSALILYVFVIAELVNIFVITPSSLLAIAFVGGFTERLLVKAVNAVGGDSVTVSPRSPQSPETDGRRQEP